MEIAPNGRTETIRIRRVGIVRTAATIAIICFIVAAVPLVPASVITVATYQYTHRHPEPTPVPELGLSGAPDNIGAVGGPEVLIVLAFVVSTAFALAGGIAAALACLAYNASARLVPGMELEIRDVSRAGRAPRPGDRDTPLHEPSPHGPAPLS